MNLLNQIRAELRRVFRSKAALIPTLLFPVMFWCFFGLPNATRTSNGFNVGAYILASFTVYSVIQTVMFNLSIAIASERETGWYKYLRTTPARVWTIFLAKLVAVLILALLAMNVLILVGNITANLGLSIEQWLSLLARASLSVLPFMAMSILIGYAVRGANTASPVINLIFFPMSFASGLFIPLDGLPKIVQDFAPYLPAYHGAQLTRVAVGIPSASGDTTHLIWILGYTLVFLVLAVLAYKRDEGANYK